MILPPVPNPMSPYSSMTSRLNVKTSRNISNSILALKRNILVSLNVSITDGKFASLSVQVYHSNRFPLLMVSPPSKVVNMWTMLSIKLRQRWLNGLRKRKKSKWNRIISRKTLSYSSNPLSITQISIAKQKNIWLPIRINLVWNATLRRNLLNTSASVVLLKRHCFYRKPRTINH